MRAEEQDRTGWAKVLGALLSVLLPIIIVARIGSDIAGTPTLPHYALSFVLVSLGAQAGLVVRRWGKIRLWRVFFNVLLALIGGMVSFGVVQLAISRGGGPVDPSFVALAMAYLLAVWSGQDR